MKDLFGNDIEEERPSVPLRPSAAPEPVKPKEEEPWPAKIRPFVVIKEGPCHTTLLHDE